MDLSPEGDRNRLFEDIAHKYVGVEAPAVDCFQVGVDREPVEGSFRCSIKHEILIRGELVHPDIDIGSEAPDEVLQPGRGETNFREPVVKDHVPGIRQSGQGAVDRSSDAIAQRLETEVLDSQVSYMARNLGVDHGGEVHLLEGLGEVRYAPEAYLAVADLRVYVDLVDEIIVSLRVSDIVEMQFRNVDIAP